MSTFSQINTNIQSQRAFQNLSDTSEELQNRQERLSTGLRINSASDDAAGFQIANQLEARTGGQQQALRNIGDAKSALSTAEGALDTQLNILQSAKEKATQAANGSLSQDERDAIANELKAQVAEINDIADNTTFNGDQLIKGGTSGENGSSVGLTFQTGATSDTTFDVEVGNSRARDLGVETIADPTTATGDIAGQSVDASSLTANSNTIETSLEGNINVSTASTDLEGKALGEGLEGGDFDVTVSTDTANSALTFEVAGPDSSTTTIAASSALTNSTANAEIDGAATTNITLESATTGTGTNTIGFEVGTLSAITDADTIDTNNSFTVSIDGSENIGSRLEGSSGDEAREIIDDVDGAIDNLTGELSNLGASQNRLSFKESNLETSQTNLSAAQSRIEDADFAKEQTQVAKLQVQQQSGTAQLAQANAAGQSVLSLLQ